MATKRIGLSGNLLLEAEQRGNLSILAKFSVDIRALRYGIDYAAGRGSFLGRQYSTAAMHDGNNIFYSR